VENAKFWFNQNPKICLDGRIFPGGYIRIIKASDNHPKTEFSGIACWNYTLRRFSNGAHAARLNTKRQSVEVIKLETGRRVKILGFDRFMNADIFEAKVAKGGFLGDKVKLREVPTAFTLAEDKVTALNRAFKGKRPVVFDNSYFTKVGPKHIGQTLLEVRLDEKNVHVYTKEGKRVRSRTVNWLAKDRWNKGRPGDKI
jgi:hypothetical protein